jgi:RNA polymerase sigma-70 factor (ECF subfamily)
MAALGHLSDEGVLDLLARSDESALAELYDRYSGPAYRLALRIVRDPALAQDAVQDAFLTVWRTAAGFDARRGSVSTWLLTLVHRRAVDVVRREDRRRGLPLADAPVPSGDATDETAETRELRRAVQEALAGLRALEREALELAYYGGLSQSEIAEKLGVPLGTVKSRMFAGLARLRDALGEAGASPFA